MGLMHLIPINYNFLGHDYKLLMIVLIFKHSLKVVVLLLMQRSKDIHYFILKYEK